MLLGSSVHEGVMWDVRVGNVWVWMVLCGGVGFHTVVLLFFVLVSPMPAPIHAENSPARKMVGGGGGLYGLKRIAT